MSKGQLPDSTVSDALKGDRLPPIRVVLNFVAACQEAARADGIDISDGLFDPIRWQSKWIEVKDSGGALGRPLAKLSDADALELGVHSAIEAAGSADLSPLPPYLDRDFDRDLRDRILSSGCGKEHIGGARWWVFYR